MQLESPCLWIQLLRNHFMSWIFQKWISLNLLVTKNSFENVGTVCSTVGTDTVLTAILRAFVPAMETCWFYKVSLLEHSSVILILCRMKCLSALHVGEKPARITPPMFTRIAPDGFCSSVCLVTWHRIYNEQRVMFAEENLCSGFPPAQSLVS